MCLLVVAFHVVPETPLLIGANRDEFLSRPTTVITTLRTSEPRVLGGRDEHSGGTWLAVNEYGVFAALTNQPLGDAKDLTKRSRGELPLALAAAPTATSAVRTLRRDYRPADYNGSWLLVGDRDSLYYVDFTGLVEPEAVALTRGIHVLENKALGAPSAKVARVFELMEGLEGDASAATGALERALADHWVPETDASDGSRVVANCVHLDEYGTRSSCMVRVGHTRGQPPDIRVADGPPCRTPFLDAGHCWHADES